LPGHRPGQFEAKVEWNGSDPVLALARSWSSWSKSPEIAFRHITETLGVATRVARCSIWRLESETQTLRLADRFLLLTGEHQTEEQIPLRHHPIYFSSIDTGRLLDISDTQNDPRIAELQDDYLQPENIGAQLDATIRHAGKTWGVISLEHVGGPRIWADSEKQLANSISELIAQFLGIEELHRSEAELRRLGNRYQTILNSTDIGILTTNCDGVIEMCNPAASELLGRSGTDLVGHYCLDELLEEGAFSLSGPSRGKIATNDSSVRSTFRELIRDLRPGQSIELETTNPRADNLPRMLLLNLTALTDEHERINGYLVVLNDLSDRVRIDEMAQRQQTLFAHITSGISAVTGGAFFDTLSAELVKALEVDYVFIGERLNDNPHIHLIAIRDREGAAPLFDYTLEGTVSAEVLQDGFCLHPRDVQQHFPDDPGLKIGNIQSYCGIELMGSDQRSLGLMAVMHSQPFEEPQLVEYLLRIFATRAATELERQIQQKHLRESREALIQRNKNLKLLNNLSLRLHGSMTIDAIIDETLDALVTLSQTPNAAFYLKGSDPWLTLANYRGYDAELREMGRTLPLEHSLSGLAIETGRVAVTNDIANDMQMEPAVREGLIRKGFVSGAIIPLIFDKQLFGTVNIMDRKPHPRGEEEISTLAALGHTVSLALSNIHRTRELTHQAEHDSLTGLPNRMMLHRQLDQLNENHRQVVNPRLSALLLLDLDRFKEINDTLGHHTGDRLLQQISPRLDMALSGSGHFLCRLGGDEFATLICDLENEAEAMYWGSKILDTLRLPFQVDDMLLEIGASIGIALHPVDGLDKHELLRMADVAMYTAKRHGGGLACYDHDNDTNSPEKLGLLSELNAAIRGGQLCLHFQPKLGLTGDRKIIGFEALVRWQHPQRGLLFPDQFMPQAEVGEAIHILTETVLDLALQQQQLWRQNGHHYAIAINLSARNLIDGRCVFILSSLLDRYDAQPDMVELEITETALMQDPEGAAKILQQMADLGVRLSIDDFGTGYSSLGYLRHLPIHNLKIDRTFVKDMLTNPQDAIIVRSTIGLAHNLGLQVIAEGVEDEATLDALEEMRCDAIQGYHISRPRPAETFFTDEG